MKTEFQYIHFVKVAEKPKTSVWSCRNNRSNVELGYVKWYGPWRQYCFMPNAAELTVFNVACLQDIQDFIRSLPRKTSPSKGNGG